MVQYNLSQCLSVLFISSKKKKFIKKKLCVKFENFFGNVLKNQ